MSLIRGVHTGDHLTLDDLLAVSQQARTPIIVAEIGASHGGDFEKALELVDVAGRADADVVKIQVGVDNLCAAGHPYAEMFDETELEPDAIAYLAAHAWTRNLGFAASVFSIHGMTELMRLVEKDSLPLSYLKIASGDMNYIDWALDVADAFPHLMVSVGGGLEHEITELVDKLGKVESLKTLALLACTVAYPAADEDARVARVQTLRKMFAPNGTGAVTAFSAVGYSDHTESGQASVLAVKLYDAQIVEKHLALEDQGDSSLTPDAFVEWVKAVRAGDFTGDAGKLAGGDTFERSEAECDELKRARRDLKTGLRPAAGVTL